MPRLGLGLGAQISASSAYDADAASYFARAGVTDVTAKRQISDFVEGLKSLGAWDNSIVYLARSDQNKGSGSTVYSLGGLTNNSSTYDATIAGSPTPIWTRSGISTSGGYWSATSPIAGGNTTRSMIAMSQRSGSTASNTDYVVLSTAGLATKRFAFRQDQIKSTSIDIFDYDAVFGKRFDSSAGFNFQSASYNSSNSSLRYNANAGTDSTATQSLSFSGGTTTTSGGWEPAVPFAGAGTLSMALVSNQFFSKTLCDAIYSLYNSTCGTNLYDVDAEAYFTTAGITDTTAKQQINDFVVGVKGLGIWNDMVCWPLRSAQNAGTGTTVYSLGGLGTYNGTLVNSPSRGVDGITFTSGSSQTITVPNITISKTDLILAACQAATSGNLRVIDFNWGADQAGFWAGFGGEYYFDSRTTAATLNRLIGGTTTTSRIFTHGIASTSGGSFFVNGTSILTNAVSRTNASPTSFRINQNGGNGNIAFAMFSQSIIGNASLYNLYKTTLGSGLGLP
jgi:hypothetical protein